MNMLWASNDDRELNATYSIFSWNYLHELGQNYTAYWRDYLDELAAKNLSRDPPKRRA